MKLLMDVNKKPSFLKSISGRMFVQTSIMLIFYSLVLLLLQFFNPSFQNSRAKGTLMSLCDEVDLLIGVYESAVQTDEQQAYKTLCEQIDLISAKNNCMIYLVRATGEELTQFYGTSSFEFLAEMKEGAGIGSLGGGDFMNKRHEYTSYISYLRTKGTFIVEILENQSYYQMTTDTTISLVRSVVILGFLLSLIWSFWYSRFFTRPITQMNSVTQHISNLDFSARCKIESSDEMGWLARNINQMSDKLQAAMNELGKKNKDLEHELNRAQQVEEMRKKFVSDVSHELKTPLSIIQGYAEACEQLEGKKNADEKRERYLRIISDETAKMNALVLDLLDLSQYESGYYLLNKQKFPIESLINDVVCRFEHTLEREGIELVLEVENGIIEGDIRRLTQVLNNLMSNAISHASNAKIIKIMGIAGQGGKYRLSVTNTGENISSADLPRVWESFYRADSARSRDKGRYGIGLSIVKVLVELHGGTVGARNLDGAVEFYFII